MNSVIEQIEQARERETTTFVRLKRRLFQKYRIYGVTFGSDEGRTVIADLKKHVGAYDTGMGDGSTAALAYAKGARDVITHIENLAGVGKLDIDRRLRELDEE